MEIPGLNIHELLALHRPTPGVDNLTQRIRQHLHAHDGYLAWSGGKDSTVALHLALQADPNIPVVFFDSGFEFPETYHYLELLQHQWHVNLHWYRATRTTLEVLAATGAWDHHASPVRRGPSLHQLLITEPAARAHSDHGPGEIWGVRAEESRGRAALYANALRTELRYHTRDCSACQWQNHEQPAIRPGTAQRRQHGGLIRRADHTVAYGPIWDWKTTDVWAYLARHHIPANPVYTKLRRLGAPEHLLRVSHMLDGSRLEEGRATWLRCGWPDIFEDLAQILPRIREFV